MASASTGWSCTHTASVVSQTNTTATIRVTCYWQNKSWNYDINNVSAWVYCNGSSYKVKNNSSLDAPGMNSRYSLGSHDFTINKTTATQSISCYGKITSNSSYVSGTKTSSSTKVSVSAKPHYTVSYNANGGSGAPGSQTKWYGTNLTLSSTRPTRTGYSFAGWATSASGSVAYQPGGTYSSNSSVTLYAKWTANTYKVSFNPNGGSGGPSYQTKTYGVNLTLSTSKPTRTNYNFLGWATSSSATSAQYQPGGTYTSNSAVTLYAVWKLAYKAPRISGFSAQRCTSNGTASESGTYIKVSFSWSTDRSVSAIRIQHRTQSSSTWTTTTVTASGTSGSVSQIIGAGGISTETSYIVQSYVQDSGGTTYSGTASIGTIIYPIDVKAGGKGIAFGKVAESTDVVDFGWRANFKKGFTGGFYGTFVSDLNTCYKSGVYYYSTSTTGRPPDSYGHVLVTVSAGDTYNGSNNWISQVAFSTTYPEIYIRNKVNNGGWNSWTRLLSYSNYTNYGVLKSGGTFTGGINVGSGNSHSAYNSQWIGWYRSNDGARVGWMGANSTNDLYITKENGGYIYVQGGSLVVKNDFSILGKKNDGSLTHLIGISSGNNVYVGDSGDLNPTGNTNIYGANMIIFCANRGAGKTDADTICIDREDSGSYRSMMRPNSTNGTIYLGTTSYRWNTGFFTNSITQSDLKEKRVLEDFDMKALAFIMNLKPIAYNRIGKGDTGKRVHLGFGAQTVNQLIKDLKIGDLALAQASIVNEDGTESPYHGEDIDDSKLSWGLNYEEFIAPIVATIQSQQKEIDDLKKQVQDLTELVLNLSKKEE